ncbi:MAG: ABC transporter permease [Promethearchaeota archaeon]
MNIRGLIFKEFGRIRSDKRTLILLFLIPLILIIVFGLTSGGGPTKYFNAAVLSKDEMHCWKGFRKEKDAHQYDDVFISVMRDNTSSFGLYESYIARNFSGYEYTFNRYIELLRQETIDVFIILPENFSESVIKKVEPVVIYYVDGSDLTAVAAIEVSLQEPIALFRIEVGMTENMTMMSPSLEFDVPFWETQVLNYAFSIMIPLIAIGTTMNLTSLSIVSEGPLPRMLLTPTAKTEIILSKLLANTLIMILQSAEIFVTIALFGLYSLGSLLELYLVLISIGFCGICIGLFISAISPSEQTANQLYIMFFITILIFSGAFVDESSLSPIMQVLINSLPLSHSMSLLVDITLKGLSISLEDFIPLNLISLVFLFLAYIVFKIKKVEV